MPRAYPFRRTRWKIQPPHEVELDYRNPLTNGLVIAPLFNGSLYDPARNAYCSLAGTGVALVDGREGLAYNLANGASTPAVKVSSSGPILGGLTNLSLMAQWIEPTTTRGGGYAVYSERAASGNDILKLEVGDSFNPGSVGITYRNDGGTLLQFECDNQGLNSSIIQPGNTGQLATLCWVKVGTAWTTYFWYQTMGGGVTGTLVDTFTSTTTFGSSSDAFTNAGVECWVGNDKADTASIMPKSIFWVLGWNRGITMAEARSIYQNPWQVYAVG